MKLQIKNRWTGKLIVEGDFSSLAELVVDAVKRRVNLVGANLSGANLSGANLVGANLYGANLEGANLVGANLSGANLEGANLSGANLEGAKLVGANLYGANLEGANLVGANLYTANLSGADLYGANLSGADLYGANLSGADLYGANISGDNLVGANLYGADLVGANLVGARLNHIRNDLWSILLFSQPEIPALRAALVEGRVNGSCYEGSCCCLVGTIANVRQCSYKSLPGITPDSSRPAEAWFTGIKPGDTAESNQLVKITLGWIDEFTAALTEVSK